MPITYDKTRNEQKQLFFDNYVFLRKEMKMQN